MKVQEGVSLEEVRRLLYYDWEISGLVGCQLIRRLPSRVPLELTIDRSSIGDEGVVGLGLTVVKDIVLPMCELAAKGLVQLLKF